MTIRFLHFTEDVVIVGIIGWNAARMNELLRSRLELHMLQVVLFAGVAGVIDVERYCYLAKVVSVVDGDTVDLDIDLGCNVHIMERCRLAGINAPETYGVKKDSEEYMAGIAVKEWLEEEIGGKEIMIRTIKDKKGKFGRYLVEIGCPFWQTEDKRYTGDIVNKRMVDVGLVVPYNGGNR